MEEAKLLVLIFSSGAIEVRVAKLLGRDADGLAFRVPLRAGELSFAGLRQLAFC